MIDVLCISDNAQNQLIIVDLEKMKVLSKTPVGAKPYPVDLIRPDVALVSTRGETNVFPVQITDGSGLPPVSLSLHRPRSTTAHPTKPLALIGGGDKVLTTVLDTGSLSVNFSVGSGASDSRRDFGGGLACGHPAWGPGDTIVHLDRITRRIELYSLANQALLSSINLPTSAHHIEPAGSHYFALCEGNPESKINPSVMKISLSPNNITVVAHAFLPIPPMSQAHTGGHHLTYDPQRDRVYVGTNDGKLFTLRGQDLRFENIIDTGNGCGHVTLCTDINLAVTTNHTDQYMTVFDLDTGKATGDILVSSPRTGNKKTQGHTSKWFAHSSRLVATAAQDGRVLEIDPTSRTITRDVAVKGAYLLQGCFAQIPQTKTTKKATKKTTKKTSKKATKKQK